MENLLGSIRISSHSDGFGLGFYAIGPAIGAYRAVTCVEKGGNQSPDSLEQGCSGVVN